MSLEDLKKMRERLDQQEAKEYKGVPSRTPKQQLLDASKVQEKMPDHRVRWIQTGNAERAVSRIHDGYEVIPENEGGRRVGGLTLARTPKKNYDERVAEVRARTKERLRAHKTEVERAAEAVARDLRDRHGISVSAEDIMVTEE